MQVENPIPFIPPLPRLLTTGFLHAQYAKLLLLPTQLSADWSYACIPPVEHLMDPRNLATILLYTALVWALARPMSEMAQHVHRTVLVALRSGKVQPAVTAGRTGSQNAAGGFQSKREDSQQEQAQGMEAR